MITDVITVPKPWGKETIWAHTEQYVGKILHVKANEALSIQYHHEKDETMYILSGMGVIKFYEMRDDVPTLSNIFIMHAGEAIHIPPMQVHNVEAISDMMILEASTNHLDDLVRVADKYNRD
jgi:mannose-6-phosphate isomerase-like protein (cupin superfamily)